MRNVPGRSARETGAPRLAIVGAWYTVGLLAGLGVAAGVLLAGVAAGARFGVAAAVAAAAAAGALAGTLVGDWAEVAAGGVGGALGAAGAAQVVRGTLRRGGTRGATALLVAGAAVVLALVALIPLAGYLEAVVVPALAARLRARAGERYAGLRVLARDE